MALVSRFLALLALAALAGSVLLLIGRRSPLGRSAAEGRLWLAWVVATVATLGSLYYSEVAGFPPCDLCWYQRIAMYPMAVILPLGARRGDLGVRRYALPLAVTGGALSVYHYLLQHFPGLEAGACRPDNPCTLRWVWELGFVSIPFMALAAFTLITVLLTLPTEEPSP